MNRSPFPRWPVWKPVPTKYGTFWAKYTERGLASLSFPKQRRPTAASQETLPHPKEIDAWHALTQKAVANVLAGRDPGKLPPLDLSSGTPFQQRVWKHLLELSPCHLVTYAELARVVTGTPNAARAVGQACRKNPIPLLIPCHLVIASNCQFGGYAHSLKWKCQLLAACFITEKARRTRATAQVDELREPGKTHLLPDQ